MSRKVAREIAFKLVFAANFQAEEINVDEMSETLIKELNKANEVNKEDLEYIKSISKGVSEKVSKLDEAINMHLKGWKMERICKTDLAILRLAIYEILYRDDIPYKVSVNEAVELAKSFGEDSSPAFINGVLAGIIKNMEETNE